MSVNFIFFAKTSKETVSGAGVSVGRGLEVVVFSSVVVLVVVVLVVGPTVAVASASEIFSSTLSSNAV